MDYYILIIAILSAMLIVSIVFNFILMRKIERLEDANMIDDITYDAEFYKMSKEQKRKIIYL